MEDRPMRSNDSGVSEDGRNCSSSDGGERRQSDAPRLMTADEIASSYADVADDLARWRRLDRLFAGRYRRRQFGKADGRVLDVACGTGRNFRYLPASAEVVGIDVSADMLAYARDELDRLALDGTVRQMDAEALEFPDDSFDTVVSSFSTCTFPHPLEALREMQRVCNPGGRILLLEHGRSDVGLLARIQDWRAESHYEKIGCRLNHEPLATVRRAGLTVENAADACLGLVRTIDAVPAGGTR